MTPIMKNQMKKHMEMTWKLLIMGSDKLHGLHHLLELGMLGLSKGRVMQKNRNYCFGLVGLLPQQYRGEVKKWNRKWRH